MEKNMEGGEVMGEYPLTTSDKNDILKAIDKAKLSILRGIHSKDKTARLLLNLVEKMHEVCPAPHWVCSGCRNIYGPEVHDKNEDQEQVTCPNCGSYMYYDDPEALIMETDAFKEADEYVLGINKIRNSKKKEDN